MQEQLEESQKHFEEIAQALKQGSTDSLKTGNKDENSKTKIAKSNSKNADKNEEIKDEAEDIIKKKYPELTKTQIDEYLDDIADKVSNTGISVERAVKAVMGDLEQAA